MRFENDRRRGDWIQTYTGKQAYPMDLRQDEIDIYDIAHSLSMQCRYNGHCIKYFSVSEHSVLIARWMISNGYPISIALWALMHDAPETYLTDVPRPIKPYLIGYKNAELQIQYAIAEKFCLAMEIPESVKDADRRILMDERQQNMAKPPQKWGTDSEPLGVSLQFWDPPTAENQFLSEFFMLSSGV